MLSHETELLLSQVSPGLISLLVTMPLHPSITLNQHKVDLQNMTRKVGYCFYDFDYGNYILLLFPCQSLNLPFGFQLSLGFEFQMSLHFCIPTVTPLVNSNCQRLFKCQVSTIHLIRLVTIRIQIDSDS